MKPMYQVFYVMSGPAHLPYLVVSLYTLRLVMPDVDILIYAWPESFEQCRRIAADVRAGCRLHIPGYRGRNDQFISKQVAAQDPSADIKLYLDADTMVNRDLQYLFDAACDHGFAATQFGSWTSHDIRPRIEWLVGRGVPQDPVRALLRNPLPSVNGGVFACQPDSPVLSEWQFRTWSVIDLFIADELVLHTFVPERMECVVTTSEQNVSWNTSPIHIPNGAEVAVWHFHGDSCCRPHKSQFGSDLWMPIWRQCWEANFGGCREWGPDAIMRNNHLRREWVI